MGERYCFQFVSPHPGGGGWYPIQPWTGGVPDPALDRGGTPTLDGGGLPHPISGGGGGTPSHLWGGCTPGTPPPAGIASTCYGYAAGGVPLAFTQEDFLVVELFLKKYESLSDYYFLKIFLQWASMSN